MALRIVSFVLLLGLPVLAADLTGKWKGQMGDNRDVVFQLKSNGDKITGTMSGPNGEARPITQGEAKGDDIALTVASEWEGQPVKLLVKGKVTGTEMKLRIQSEGNDWSTDAVVKKTE